MEVDHAFAIIGGLSSLKKGNRTLKASCADTMIVFLLHHKSMAQIVQHCTILSFCIKQATRTVSYATKGI